MIKLGRKLSINGNIPVDMKTVGWSKDCFSRTLTDLESGLRSFPGRFKSLLVGECYCNDDQCFCYDSCPAKDKWQRYRPRLEEALACFDWSEDIQDGAEFDQEMDGEESKNLGVRYSLFVRVIQSSITYPRKSKKSTFLIHG